jgi:hopanoid biosynthesis associated RND transporter like protein HpnN
MSRAPDAPTRTARLAAVAVAVAARRPWAVLALAAASVAACGWLAAARLEYHTQRNDLLSAEKDVQKRWQKYLDAFGDDDDLVVVIKGADRRTMAAAADAVADRLAARPDLFDRVFHRVDLRPLYGRSLLFLSADELRAIDRRLDGMAPLLGPLGRLTWPTLTVQMLLAQGVAAADAVAAGRPVGPFDRDLLAQLPAVLQSAADAIRDPAAYQNPWAVGTRDDRRRELEEPQYFFTPDGRLAMVLARPRKAADSFAPAKAAADAARAILADVRGQFPGLDLGVTGLPVLETDEMAASDEDSTAASWLALAGVAALYFVVYRGFRYPLLTVGTLLVGTAWALGWATLTVGHLNILSATFAVMIIGMGDYGVLWVARYDAERAAGLGVRGALAETAAHAGPSILTAAATTALAFFATMSADFKAVAELGWIAGSGVLFCSLACLTVLPALLSVVERRRPTAGRPAVIPIASARPFLPRLSARPRLVAAVSAVGLVVAGGFAARVRYDANLLNMQARGLDSVAWEQELIAHAAGATWDAMSVARSADEAAALRARYEATPGVGRVVDAASLVPADQPAKLPLVARIRKKLADLPAAADGGASDPAEVRALLDRFEKASPGPAAALRDALARPDAAARLAAFDGRLRADLLADLRTLRSVATPEPITPADLPTAFRERYVGANGEFLVRAFAADSLWELDALERFTAAARAADPDATGKSFRTLEGLRQMRAGFETAGAVALLVIVAVLWLDLRRPRAVLLGLLPLAAGVVCTLGVMGAAGLPLNPANLIALPLIVGVGVDNGVHVLHDHAERTPGRLYRLGAATGRGITVAGLTTVLGFGALGLARHRGMASLGLALTLGVTFCMAAAVLLLPAILRLADARRLRRPMATPAPEAVRRAA